jgi:hypothetical protein
MTYLGFAVPVESLAIMLTFGVGGAIAIIAIVTSMARDMTRTRQVEQTKREVAAYVAEGSMSADDAQKILANLPKSGGCSCTRKA